ncbi:TIL and CBM 14 domain containing protein [Trichuris trichiura]|uniref:TIL and CBM 14 domain containing protein n=1 Tax=Trichuris trichiura TaxID=36087 RepID=A0A077ZFY4_TRITR|nr:TIL and CBM 14 domain containing protein [Trichuris trichiura]
MTTDSRWTMGRGKLKLAFLLVLILLTAFGQAGSICNGKSNGDYGYPLERCSSRYFSCVNGKTVDRHCPHGLYFHPHLGKCDWPRQIPGCNGREEKVNFHCPAEDGDYADADDLCSAKFWRCTHGKAELYTCKNDQLFDDKLGRCSAPTGKCAFCLHHLKGQYRSMEGSGCSPEYFDCVDDYGKTSIKHCHNGLVFSEETKHCQPKSAVAECNPELLHTEEEGEEREGGHQHVAESVDVQNGYRPHTVVAQSCTSPKAMGKCIGEYEGCNRGKPEKRFCAIGLVYFEDYGGCVEPSHSPECPKMERRASSRFRCSDMPGVKLARGKCKPEYVQCMGEIAVRQWCAPDEIFDPQSESCVHVSLTDDCMPAESHGPSSIHDSFSRFDSVCSKEDRQIKRRRALEHCSKNYVQCDEQLGDKMRSCSRGIYDESYDRCLPRELSRNCHRADAIPFYPLTRRRKRIGRSLRLDKRRGMFNPSLFKGNGPPGMEMSDMDEGFRRDLSSPRRETHFGLNKFSKTQIEIGGETIPLPTGQRLQEAPTAGHAAVIANFEGLNFDEGPRTAATAVPVIEQNLMPQSGEAVVVPRLDVVQQPPAQIVVPQANVVHQPPIQEDLPEPPVMVNVPQNALASAAAWHQQPELPPDNTQYRQQLPPPIADPQVYVNPAAEPQRVPIVGQAAASSDAHVLGPVKPGMSPQKDGVYSYGHCRRDYAVCRAKREIRLTCAIGELFDPDLFHCTSNYGYACATKRTTTTTLPSTTASSDVPNSVCSNRQNGYYAIAFCSRFYYSCSNGDYQLYQCQYGEVFSDVQRRCVVPGLGCTSSSDSMDTSLGTYPGTSLPRFCTGSFEIWSDCASPCGKEATCGHRYPQNNCNHNCKPGCVCRPGYVRLSEQSRICVPEDACLQYTLTNRALDQTYCQFRPDGLYPYPGKVCDQRYLRCRAGALDTQLCDQGKVFDAVKSQCVYEMACKAPRPTAGGLDSYFCRGKPSGAYNLPGKTCFTIYYLCSDGIVSFGKCSNGYVFDLHLGCVPPSHCDDGPVDPKDLYCAGKRDGSYAFGNYKCFPIYYTCQRGKANFAICRSSYEDLVFDGRHCVSRNSCLGPKHQARPPMPVYYESPFNQSTTFDPTFCVNQPDGAYPIVECTSPYLVCINSVTTIHYCFPGEIFARVNLPAGVVYQCAMPKYTLCIPKYSYAHHLTDKKAKTTVAPTVNNNLCLTAAVNNQLHPLSNNPCDKHYINCTGGSFYLGTCPDKTVFNSTSLMCEGNFACLKQPPPDYRQLCHDRTNGFYTFSLCSHYYLYCQDNIGWVQSCLNPHWVFNGQTMQCAPRNSVSGCQPAGLQWYEMQYKQGDLSALDMRCQTLGDRGYEISPCQSDFIVCNMGYGDVRSCGSDMVFYGDQQRCAKMSDVPACQSKGGDSLCLGKRDEAYPFAPCSQQFYICWKGFSYVERCGSREIFSSQLQSCVNISSVQSCLASGDSSPQNDPSPKCTKPGIKSMGQCHPSFHVCTTYGKLIVVHCGRGDEFDEKLRICVPAPICGKEQVSIDHRQQQESAIPESDSSSMVADSADLVGFCGSRKDGLYSIAKDCRRFVQCSDHMVHVRTCPDGWVFNMNPQDPRCDLPRNVPACQQADVQDAVTSPPATSSDSVNSFCAEKADGFYRHMTDCSKFIQCFRRRSFVLSCATGLVFNPLIHVCDFPRRVPDCNIAMDDAADETPMDSICSEAEHGAFVRDPYTCTAYHRCVHGKAYRFNCPATLVFNTRINVCDYPTRVPECSP